MRADSPFRPKTSILIPAARKGSEQPGSFGLGRQRFGLGVDSCLSRDESRFFFVVTRDDLFGVVFGIVDRGGTIDRGQEEVDLSNGWAVAGLIERAVARIVWTLEKIMLLRRPSISMTAVTTMNTSTCCLETVHHHRARRRIALSNRDIGERQSPGRPSLLKERQPKSNRRESNKWGRGTQKRACTQNDTGDKEC